VTETTCQVDSLLIRNWAYMCKENKAEAHRCIMITLESCAQNVMFYENLNILPEKCLKVF
jgi:hypothetical protein